MTEPASDTTHIVPPYLTYNSYRLRMSIKLCVSSRRGSFPSRRGEAPSFDGRGLFDSVDGCGVSNIKYFKSGKYHDN